MPREILSGYFIVVQAGYNFDIGQNRIVFCTMFLFLSDTPSFNLKLVFTS